MEFKISQDILQKELGFICPIVDRKSTIPMLQHLLIESIGENAIRITGTDLDVTMRVDATAEIIKAGSVCLPAGKLFDVVKLCDGDLHFTVGDKDNKTAYGQKLAEHWVMLKAGRPQFKIPGTAADNFPEVAKFKSVPLKLDAGVFHYLVKNTAFAITQEQSRYTLSGAKLEVAPDYVRMITTDGHRLAFIEKPVGKDDPVFERGLDVLVPKKALVELDKITQEFEGVVSFGADPNLIFFEVGDRTLITRKLSGNFPDYNAAIPKDSDKAITFDLDEMRVAVKRAMLMADDRTRAMRLTVRPGEFEVWGNSAENGESSEVIPCEYDGEEVTLGYNAQYLLEFLVNNTMPAEEVKEGEPAPTKKRTVIFEFKDANAQTLMRMADDGGYDYRYVVMPLRI